MIPGNVGLYVSSTKSLYPFVATLYESPSSSTDYLGSAQQIVHIHAVSETDLLGSLQSLGVWLSIKQSQAVRILLAPTGRSGHDP